MKRVLSINHHQDPAIGREKRLKTPISDQNLRGNYLQQKPNAEYTVGWICAATTDDFTLGRIGKHNVVIAILPTGEYGTASAATVAADMSHNFPNIRIRLMVGIGGGAPSERNDIRLGDIVVSAPSNGKSGVFQYDYGRTIQGQPFQQTRFLDQSPMILRTAMTGLMAQYECEGHQLEETIKIALERSPKLLGKYSRPHESSDRLYCNTFVHPSNDGSDCAKSCGDDSLIMRPRRTQENSSLVIHYGMIASANQLMKNAIFRDKMSSEYHVLCFEMEAGGLMNTFPCLVIRGICDYSDSHTNKIWEGYAAMAAAAYAKDLINRLPPLESAVPQNTNNSSSNQLHPQGEMPYTITVEQINALLNSLRFDQIGARQMTIKNAHAKTCEWLLQKPEYIDWLDPAKIEDHHGFLWIRGKPGAGKSTLMKFALNSAKRSMRDKTVIYFFFNARGEDLEISTIGMYRSILLQLLEKIPALQHKLEVPRMAVRPGEEYIWTPEILTNMLDQAVQNLERWRVVCFIDALDECDEDQIRDMVAFFQRIGESATAGNFRVCFSSRHYPHISIAKGLHLTLEGQEGHGQDIISYINSELKIGNSDLADQIRAELREKASGVFMWVVLVVRILNKASDKGHMHDLRKRLQEIPGDLHELFRDMLTRDHEGVDELVLCIQWILFARHPLQPEELYFAILSNIQYEWKPEITISGIERFILNSSKGLAEVTKSDKRTVQFIHESVKDYLLKENGLRDIWPEFDTNICGESHERLKQCCQEYMDNRKHVFFKKIDSFKRVNFTKAKQHREFVNSSYPFLEYAMKGVLYHANEAEASGINQADFLQAIAYILAENNMSHLIRRYPNIRSFLRVENERYGVPIFAALAANSKESVKVFLNAYVEIDPELRDIIDDYYRNGIKRNSFGRNFNFFSKSKINTKDNNGMTPLSYATKHCVKSLAHLLICQGAEINIKDSNGKTPLSYAAEHCDESLTSLLISQGAEIDAKDNNGRTPLSHAAEHCALSLAKLLIAEGAEIDAKDNNGRTPLSYETIIIHTIFSS
ncbi:hypothetical protein M431DRAFT_523369 [Trichoderma harzianum CBS 226.95]|uniref:Nephrocystin 3-like N-terminal domain-containing protein n=1 Tax=Trichoderma harzianum CBS 226.95 TaxID=983964 RepID=A0A2T4A0S2_TRIHA|nr:hypothetical protein M431DRAFT_523369 [Trichoderma harzianum CBS 226.95]PTB50659.1 hypothetical protein M431DRAFT_523369 [Trichoderma harzianum CBS 226.95]